MSHMIFLCIYPSIQGFKNLWATIVEFDVAIWRNVYTGSIIKLRRGQWNLFHLLAFSSIFGNCRYSDSSCDERLSPVVRDVIKQAAAVSSLNV